VSEELLIRFCSPTLAGLKTGSLVSAPLGSREDTVRDVRRFNQALIPKGLRILPLRYTTARALIYLFRPTQLQRDLTGSEAAKLLAEAGYRNTRLEGCVMELIRRMNTGREFPHEVGLFLGYPPEDVRGFIENQACNFKCVGYWKVYGDECAARKRFAQYERCTKAYCRQWEHGKTVAQLAVSVP
jgi:hypothetical protein